MDKLDLEALESGDESRANPVLTKFIEKVRISDNKFFSFKLN